MKIINIKNQLLHCDTIDFITFRDCTNIDSKSLLKLHQEYFDKSVNFTIYMNRENQTFIEILYGHAKYIKDNIQCFDLKKITNLYVPNYFQRLNSAMPQAK